MSSLSDNQLTALLEILIAQEKEILALRSATYALRKIVGKSLGAQTHAMYARYAQEFRWEVGKHGSNNRLDLLESLRSQTTKKIEGDAETPNLS